MESYISVLLASRFIHLSSLPVGAVLCFVKKKDGSLRPRIDFGVHGDSTPFPLIDVAFGLLHKARFFVQLDLGNACHFELVREGDEWKTAFKSPPRHFEDLVMPFGHTNAPAAFQALVNDILRDMLSQFLFVYIHDILFFSETREAHVQYVRLVLRRLLENKVFLKAEKCEFYSSSVSFLGFVVQKGQLLPDPAKLHTVVDWPTHPHANSFSASWGLRIFTFALYTTTVRLWLCSHL